MAKRLKRFFHVLVNNDQTSECQLSVCRPDDKSPWGIDMTKAPAVLEKYIGETFGCKVQLESFRRQRLTNNSQFLLFPHFEFLGATEGTRLSSVATIQLLGSLAEDGSVTEEDPSAKGYMRPEEIL
jgi:hypothetical protein